MPKPGDRLDLYVNVRQKNMRLLRRVQCSKVDPITIRLAPADMVITICGEQLSLDEARAFAWRDGFRPRGTSLAQPGDALDHMQTFWIIRNGLIAERPWRGVVIHWLVGVELPGPGEKRR